jgi:hypothetical protein
MQNSLMAKLFPVWLSIQTELSEVIRWGRHRASNPKLRVQSTDKHALSFIIVSKIALLHLDKYYGRHYDTFLLSTTIDLHDLPEGFLKRDITLREKVEQNDVDEYKAFKQKFQHLSPAVYEYLEYAYLIQFALKDSGLFPEDARKVMTEIRKDHMREAMLFRALEGWEYIFYAYEAYLDHKDAYILYDVVESQLKKLQHAARDIAGFRLEIFTKEFEDWCLEVIEKKGHV